MVEDTVTKKFLMECKDDYCMSLDPMLTVVKYEDKRYILRRLGKCDYKKCKNACCKFICAGSKYQRDYFLGFGKKSPCGNGVIINKRCSRLTRKGECPLFDKKRFPVACKQFPLPLDEVYHIVYNKCGFRFKIEEELKDKINEPKEKTVINKK